MARKSKTQKAKAAAARAARKQARIEEKERQKNAPQEEVKEEPKKGLKKVFSKKQAPKEQEKTAAQLRQERRDKKMAEKENRAPKKHGRIVQFFIDVKAEMKRVTWPTKKDVAQWTGVVIGALVFFGVYVAILDNCIVTPLLLFISNLGG